METNSTILTSAYVDASTGNLILSAATPVYDENGKNIIGVAGADIALEHIDELLSAYKIGNNGFVILVTSDGTIIYHPNSDNQLKNLSELNVSDSVMKAIQSQNGTSVKYKADGSSKYGYVGRIGTTDYYTLSHAFQRIFSKPDPVYHYCTAACNCWSCHYHYGNQTSGRQYHKTDRCIK